MALTDEQRVVAIRRLADAEEKRHLLLTGKSVEQFIDQNGESVKYTKTTIASLDKYIAELQALLNPAAARQAYRRPLGFVF